MISWLVPDGVGKAAWKVWFFKWKVCAVCLEIEVWTCFISVQFIIKIRRCLMFIRILLGEVRCIKNQSIMFLDISKHFAGLLGIKSIKLSFMILLLNFHIFFLDNIIQIINFIIKSLSDKIDLFLFYFKPWILKFYYFFIWSGTEVVYCFG